MATLEYQASIQAASEQSSTRQALGDIRGLGDPNDQFLALDRGYAYGRCKLPQELSFEDVNELIDFAADPDSSSSLLVRAQAFELAAEALLKAGADELAPLRQEMTRFIPKRFQERIALIKLPTPAVLPEELDFNPLYSNYAHSEITGSFNPYKYRDIVAELADREGIDREKIFPDWHAFNPDYFYGLDDSVPAMALLLLESLGQRIGHYDRGERPLSISPFTKLIPLAIDIQNSVAHIADYKLAETANAAEIKRDAEEIREFLGAGKDAARYAEILQDVQFLGYTLPVAFPDRFKLGAVYGARALFADCLYAVRAHLQNGLETHVQLPLNGDGAATLELNLEGDEPLHLLHTVANVISQLNHVAKDPNFSVTRVNKGNGFRLYRLWPKDSLKNAISVYLRPRGDEVYDPHIEYGRNGEGVEASISYVIDPTIEEGEAIEIGKHRSPGPDNRISIRLDREGIEPALRGKPGVQRDPTQEQGTLSLDIGSVLGDEDWLSTKVGRFLAWGNLLRAQAVGQESQLNHATAYFSAETGKAEIFAEETEKLIGQLEQRRLTKKQLNAHFSGATALHSLQQVK